VCVCGLQLAAGTPDSARWRALVLARAAYVQRWAAAATHTLDAIDAVRRHAASSAGGAHRRRVDDALALLQAQLADIAPLRQARVVLARLDSGSANGGGESGARARAATTPVSPGATASASDASVEMAVVPPLARAGGSETDERAALAAAETSVNSVRDRIKAALPVATAAPAPARVDTPPAAPAGTPDRVAARAALEIVVDSSAPMPTSDAATTLMEYHQAVRELLQQLASIRIDACALADEPPDALTSATGADAGSEDVDGGAQLARARKQLVSTLNQRLSELAALRRSAQLDAVHCAQLQPALCALKHLSTLDTRQRAHHAAAAHALRDHVAATAAFLEQCIALVTARKQATLTLLANRPK
jgi:hypothetical protein